MKILVTGGAGFIGSHLADRLLGENYSVVIADNLSTGKKENLNPSAVFYEIDIRSSELEKIFQEHEIDFVLHQAAQASVGVSTNYPCKDLAVNVVGTLNLLTLCEKYKVKKFITASTAAVYGMPEYLPVDEKHSIIPLSFYGLSKHTAERYIEMSGVDHIIFRYANVYGPRQDALGEAGVVCIFADRMKKNAAVEIHGDGLQVRDFISVNDIVNANLLAIKSEAKNIKMNVSSNTGINILELFNTMKELTGYSKEPIFTSARKGDIRESILENSLLRKTLGWECKTILKHGLAELL